MLPDSLISRAARALLAALPLLWAPLAGQQSDPLGPLVAEALRNNSLMDAARLSEEKAAAGVREARALMLPSLGLESRYSRQNGSLNIGDFVNPAYQALNQLTGTNRFPTDLDITLPLQHDSRLRLAQPLVNFGIWANRSVAGHRYEAQRFQRYAFARRLAADVQAAYLTAASARSAVEIRESTLRLVQESERVAERLLEAGRATPDAVLRARADRSEAEQQLMEARDDLAAATRSLNQLAGRPLDAPLEAIADSLLIHPIPLERDAAVAHALDHREELAALEAGAGAADAGARVARSAFLPSVSLALDVGYQGRNISFTKDNDYIIGSVVVSWNLFNGGGDLARLDAARAEGERLRAERRDAGQKVRLDVLRAWDAAAVARAAIVTADDRLSAADRAYELVRRRYDEGLAPQVELIDARTALTSARLNRSVTLYRYAARLVDLERAAALREIN